jgi:hypothetical protein
MPTLPNGQPFYAPPFGTPLFWRDEATGVLPAAVKHFFDQCLGHCPNETAADLGIAPLSAAEIKLLADYLVYFIHTPCWENNITDCEKMRADLMELRTRAMNLGSVEALRRWLEEALDLGLDPF